MAHFFARCLLASLLAAAAAACGPVAATSLIDAAAAASARAHAAGGDKYAPYETTSADLYLQKAREQDGHARYADAAALARTSRDFADQAAQKAAAQRGPDGPEARPPASANPPPAADPAARPR